MRNFNIPISDKSKQLLGKAEFDSVLRLPPMSNAEYDNIKYAVEYIGGHWRERYGGFIFDDTNEHIQAKLRILQGLDHITISSMVKYQIDYQFYPTPDWIALDMVRRAEIAYGEKVLEPSAGKAAILKHIRNRTPNYSAVELSEECAKWLRNHGYRVNRMSFESYYKTTHATFDKVVMNPPFSEKRDLLHTVMAYNLLKPGGMLVGLVAENSLFYNRPITRNFNRFLECIGGTKTDIPHGSFKESGTLVDITMLMIPRVDGKIYTI